MQTLSYKLSPFTKARFILIGWYTVILFLILIAFSIVLIVTYSNDVTRIVLKQDFGSHVPSKLTPTELRLVLAQGKELRSTARFDIIVIDLVTLLVGGALSYFLAGKTLNPIQKSITGQRLFVADASHELKSPVATIQSATEVALRSRHKTKEEYKEALIQIHEQSLRLGKLINDLLSLSVLDAGDNKELKKLNLSSLVEKELKILSPVLINADTSLETFIDQNTMIMGDEESLQKLIIILIDNAVKFTSKGGNIAVSVLNKPTPSILVKDSGIGIAKDKQENIFKRFYQADASHAQKGAGLGLAIAESIMQFHKGEITVQSTLGKGSTFSCTFPKISS